MMSDNGPEAEGDEFAQFSGDRPADTRVGAFRVYDPEGKVIADRQCGIEQLAKMLSDYGDETDRDVSEFLAGLDG